MDARELLAVAEAVTDDAEAMFLAGVGADPAELKQPGDFATEVDLTIEAHLRQMLTQFTGIPVLGEEAGGSYNHDAVWIVDPIDGTANYAVGNPFCCILVSLIHQGETLLSVTEMPLLGRRITAHKDHGLFVDGNPARPMPPSDAGVTQISFGSILSQRRGNLPISYRQDMLNEIGKSYPRMRVTGSVGIDLAFTAAGVFGGTVTFSPNLWDNAAGILAVEANGGVATDFAGNPWRPGVSGLVAGEPDVHATLLEHIQNVPIGTAARTAQEIMDRGGIR